jgi:hypothetical protein
MVGHPKQSMVKADNYESFMLLLEHELTLGKYLVAGSMHRWEIGGEIENVNPEKLYQEPKYRYVAVFEESWDYEPNEEQKPVVV